MAGVTAPGIGTLTWLPALDHPEWVAAPVAASLARLPAPDRVFVTQIDDSLADTTAFCAAYQVPLEVSANCVVVAGRRGEESRMAACLVLATDRADVNKTVRKHLGVRKLSFASTDLAVQLTGMAYGGITPIGLPESWPVLVDEAVARNDWVVIGGGVRGSKLALPGAVVAGLPGAEVLALALPAA